MRPLLCPICQDPINCGEPAAVIYYNGEHRVVHPRCADPLYAARMEMIEQLHIPGMTVDAAHLLASEHASFASLIENLNAGDHIILYYSQNGTDTMASPLPSEDCVIDYLGLRSPSSFMIPKYSVSLQGCKEIRWQYVYELVPTTGTSLHGASAPGQHYQGVCADPA